MQRYDIIGNIIYLWYHIWYHIAQGSRCCTTATWWRLQIETIRSIIIWIFCNHHCYFYGSQIQCEGEGIFPVLPPRQVAGTPSQLTNLGSPCRPGGPQVREPPPRHCKSLAAAAAAAWAAARHGQAGLACTRLLVAWGLNPAGRPGGTNMTRRPSESYWFSGSACQWLSDSEPPRLGWQRRYVTVAGNPT